MASTTVSPSTTTTPNADAIVASVQSDAAAKVEADKKDRGPNAAHVLLTQLHKSLSALVGTLPDAERGKFTMTLMLLKGASESDNTSQASFFAVVTQMLASSMPPAPKPAAPAGK